MTSRALWLSVSLLCVVSNAAASDLATCDTMMDVHFKEQELRYGHTVVLAVQLSSIN